MATCQTPKSVITAAIYHGTLNAIAGIGVLYLVGGNDLTNGVTGIAGEAGISPRILSKELQELESVK